MMRADRNQKKNNNNRRERITKFISPTVNIIFKIILHELQSTVIKAPSESHNT